MFDTATIHAIDDAAASGELRFYNQGIDARRAIAELLISDVRPTNAYRRAKASTDALCRFRFDMLLVGFIRRPSDNVIARIVDVQIENERTDKELQAGTRARY